MNVGERLIQAGLITQQDLQAALEEQRRTGEPIGAVLVRLNLATEKQVTKALAYQIGLPYISLTDEPPERAAVVLIPRHIALDRMCVAVRLENSLLTVAAADPLSASLARDLESVTGLTIRQVVAPSSDILDSIARGYPAAAPLATVAAGGQRPLPGVSPPTLDDSSPTIETSATQPPEDRRDRTDVAAVDDVLALIVKRAIASGATDVHIDPREHGVVVRHRIDGVLTEPLHLPQWACEALVARIKQLGGLGAGETDLPQEGRVRFPGGGNAAEFRAFTLRTLFGEKAVLRVLGRRKAPVPLEELGLPAIAMETVRDFVHHPHGILLVAGPSASGRTTTLASVLGSANPESRNIVTIEDAIEYQIQGVNQTQLNDKNGVTTEAALAAILQQDPDVLLIDHLSDAGTVRGAMQAAQTRQLVLAALHADNAPSATTRLANMGVEPALIGSALIGVIGQRLVRRLCVACRRQHTPGGDTLRALSIPESSAGEMAFYHAVGCDECHYTGYTGRIALFEVMRITERLRRLIAQRAGEDLVREAAIEGGMVPLGEDGLAKVKAGITTADELLRVLTQIRDVRATCPECGGAVGIDFKVCPQCSHRLSGGCHKCGRALQSEWAYCPYCAAAAHKKRKKSKEHKTLDMPASNVAEFKNR